MQKATRLARVAINPRQLEKSPGAFRLYSTLKIACFTGLFATMIHQYV
jgi:hypothetical protein